MTTGRGVVQQGTWLNYKLGGVKVCHLLDCFELSVAFVPEDDGRGPVRVCERHLAEYEARQQTEKSA
jgi:hypothetical protein